jgi:hypothetical protein
MSTENQNVSHVDQLLNEAADLGIVEKPASSGQQGGTGTNEQNNEGNEGDQGKGDQGKGDAGKGQPQLDQTAVLNFLKSQGIEVEKLEDLKKPAAPPVELTAEQKAEQEKEKRAKAIQFGITNKVFTQEEYDASVQFAGRNPVDVVREDFTAAMKKSHPDLSDDDISDMFEERFFLSEDEDGPKFKLGQQDLQEYYNRIKQQRFGKVLGVDKIYEGYESNIGRAQSYTTQINELFKELPAQYNQKIQGQDIPAFSFTIGKEQVPIPIDLALLDTIKQEYLTEAHMSAALDQTGKIDKAALTDEILKDLFWKSKDKIIAEVATAYSDKRVSEEKRGRKNAILADDTADDKSRSGESRTLADRLMAGEA